VDLWTRHALTNGPGKQLRALLDGFFAVVGSDLLQARLESYLTICTLLTDEYDELKEVAFIIGRCRWRQDADLNAAELRLLLCGHPGIDLQELRSLTRRAASASNRPHSPAWSVNR
jgi:hypothetical protein